MKWRFYSSMAMGIVWLLSSSAALGQEKPKVLLSAAARDSHQMNMSGTKDDKGFQHVHALAIDADGRTTLFLGAHTGLFRSEDSGRSWKKTELSTKQSSFDVMAVTPDPKDPKTLYVATHEAGVFKSTDGGMNWKEINTGLGGPDVHGLAIDPKDGKVHALVREKGEGVYRSANGGGKWTRVDDGPGGEVKVLASVNISTGMGGIFLYAGTAEGLQRSPDCF